MSMDGNGLSVADALALGRDNDGMFGDGNGSWIFFLFFLLAWGGNFGNWGGNGMNSTASAYTDSAVHMNLHICIHINIIAVDARMYV